MKQCAGQLGRAVFVILRTLRMTLMVSCACVLASCASKPSKLAVVPGRDTSSYSSNGAVNAEIIAAPEGSRYEVKPGVIYILPVAAAPNPVPTYPPFLLAKRLEPIEVIARVIVNAAGSVDTATVIQNSSQEQAFSDATLVAVKTWTFSPLKRTEGLLTEPIPFTQEYRITFKQVDGHAVVFSGVRQ